MEILRVIFLFIYIIIIIYINNIEYSNISLVGRAVDETGKRENGETAVWRLGW